MKREQETFNYYRGKVTADEMRRYLYRTLSSRADWHLEDVEGLGWKLTASASVIKIVAAFLDGYHDARWQMRRTLERATAEKKSQDSANQIAPVTYN